MLSSLSFNRSSLNLKMDVTGQVRRQTSKYLITWLQENPADTAEAISPVRFLQNKFCLLVFLLRPL